MRCSPCPNCSTYPRRWCTADHFFAEYVNGTFDDRLMNKVSASGTLPDGRSFRVFANESQARTSYQVVIR